MKFVCPHCGAGAFQFLTGVDGKRAAECLNCGKATAFDQLTSSEPQEGLGTQKPPSAGK